MKWYIITATVCITVLLIVALLRGIDGTALASGIGVIAGLGCYFAGKARKS